jgi:hypothetical protein
MRQIAWYCKWAPPNSVDGRHSALRVLAHETDESMTEVLFSRVGGEVHRVTTDVTVVRTGDLMPVASPVSTPDRPRIPGMLPRPHHHPRHD